MKTLDTLTEQPGRRVRRYYEVWKVWGIDVFESKRQPEKVGLGSVWMLGTVLIESSFRKQYPMIGKL
jgi:hypothetical protein